MDLNFLPIFFGAIIGAVISVLSILVYSLFKRQTDNQIQKNKDEIMKSIGELCAEIDSLIASNKEGILKNAGIQNALRKKYDEITRLIRPNMHILDVYFVKYIDFMQRDYLKFLSENPENATSNSAQKSISFTIDKNTDSKSNSGSTIDRAISATQRTGSVEQDIQALESAFFKEPEDKPTDESLSLKSDDNKIIQESTNKTALSDQQKDVAIKSEESSSKDASVEEEEFTMETIMDLDISKITRGVTGHTDTNITIQKTEKTPQPIQTPTNENSNEDIDIFEPKPESSKKPTDTLPQNKSSESIIATPSMGMGKTPVKRYSEPVANEKKDIEITGDDVADQIDSFFGFDKK